MSTSTAMPANRGLVVLVAAALTLSVLVPLMTPPPVDAISDDIVISEFRARGPLGGNDEFVELYNGSTARRRRRGMVASCLEQRGHVGTRATIPAGTTDRAGLLPSLHESTPDTGYSGSVAGRL